MSRELTNQVLILDGREFAIQAVIGQGASCVVYRAECPDKTEHLLKEYNPRHIAMYRESTGELCLESEEDREEFEAGLVHFREGHTKQRELRLDSDLKNSTSNVQGIYKANGTEYIDMTCFNGETYDQVQEKSVYDLLRRMKALAQVIGNYHKAGLLHLDIKPENIFTLPETCEMVMLFDFDSVVSRESAAAGGARSYTLSWAAPEQTNPLKRNTICEATDIFAVGEMIFCQLMGRQSNGSYRHSTTEERLSFAEYHFDRTLPIFENVNPKVFPLLEELLHKTICVSVKQRYQTTADLIATLDKVIAIANPETPYLRSSPITTQNCFEGRSLEISEMHSALKEQRILFLWGIGGIGKSELAKHYALEYENDYDIVIFVPCISSIQMLLQSDAIPLVNFYRDPEENPESYCARKIKTLHKLCDKRVLFVIDNLNNDKDPDLSQLLNLNCTFIITTRTDFSRFGIGKQIKVGALKNRNDIRKIFDKHFTGVLSAEDDACVEKIIDLVAGHTMAIELIAKQVEAEWTTVSSIYERMILSGLQAIGCESVDSGKDNRFHSTSAYGHIKQVFNLSVFEQDGNQHAIYILANLSLIPHTGMDRKLFSQWCNLAEHGGPSCVNNLTKAGWIRMENNTISMHPVVSDVAIALMQNDISLGDTFYSNIKITADECSADLSNVLSYINLLDYIANRTKQYNLASNTIASFYCTDFWGQSTVCGNLNRLLSYYQNAIEMTSRFKGDSSQDLVDAYGNAACIYMDLGDYPKAKQYTIMALEICRKVFASEDNAYAVQLYNNLGLIYDKEDDVSNSFQYYEQSLNLHKLLNKGEEDELTATIHHNIACVLRKGNRFEKSIYHFHVAMNIWERIYGEGCVQTSYVYGGLGELYSITGAYEKAETCILHALMIKKAKLGDENADVADSLCMLGRLYNKLGRTQESVDNLRTALGIRKIVLGDNHTKTIELKELLHTVESQC